MRAAKRTRDVGGPNVWHRVKYCIAHCQRLHGYDVMANDRQFVEPRSPRMEAKWRAVARELVAAQLIEPVDPNDEINLVTDVHTDYPNHWNQAARSLPHGQQSARLLT